MNEYARRSARIKRLTELPVSRVHDHIHAEQYSTQLISDTFWIRLIAFLISLAPAVTHAAAHEEVNGSEFLLFLSAEQAEKSGVNTATIEESDFTPALDLLYSYSQGQWTVLGEYLLTDDEHELERLQVGYGFSEDSTFWFGRFHLPTSAWTSRYHHGRFLQSSVSRPEIENWEDEGGVLPSHISGVMVDCGIPHSRGNGSRLSLVAGAGPFLQSQELSPFNLLGPGDGTNGLSIGFSYSYFPDFISDTNFGIAGYFTQIKVLENPLQNILNPLDIDQLMLGAQIDWRKENWQLIAAAYYVDNESSEPIDRFGGWFVSAYVEVLRSVGERSTFYLRGESSDNTETAGYLNLFPNFVTDKIIGGFRFDVLTNHAFKIEISDESSLLDDYQQIRLEWSAVFQ